MNAKFRFDYKQPNVKSVKLRRELTATVMKTQRKSKRENIFNKQRRVIPDTEERSLERPVKDVRRRQLEAWKRTREEAKKNETKRKPFIVSTVHHSIGSPYKARSPFKPGTQPKTMSSKKKDIVPATAAGRVTRAMSTAAKVNVTVPVKKELPKLAPLNFKFKMCKWNLSPHHPVLQRGVVKKEVLKRHLRKRNLESHSQLKENSIILRQNKVWNLLLWRLCLLFKKQMFQNTAVKDVRTRQLEAWKRTREEAKKNEIKRKPFIVSTVHHSIGSPYKARSPFKPGTQPKTMSSKKKDIVPATAAGRVTRAMSRAAKVNVTVPVKKELPKLAPLNFKFKEHPVAVEGEMVVGLQNEDFC